MLSVFSRFFLLFFSLYAPVCLSIPPFNLAYEKQALIDYYTSQQFDRDVTKVLRKPKDYLIKRIAQNNKLMSPKKLAIVLDIDDTSLTNYFAFKKRDFSNLPLQIIQNYQQGHLPPIKPILALYQEAIRNNVYVFFISFRPEVYLHSTEANLKEAGFRKWEKIYLPNTQEFELSPNVFKTNLRKKIQNDGYTIVLNIGDQDSDLEGGYAEKVSKVPNPLYTYNPLLEA